MTSQDDMPCDDDADFTWSMSADTGSVDNLWTVTVTVKRRQTDSGVPIQCVLTQMILDPSIAGSTQDVPAVAAKPSS